MLFEKIGFVETRQEGAEIASVLLPQLGYVFSSCQWWLSYPCQIPTGCWTKHIDWGNNMTPVSLVLSALGTSHCWLEYGYFENNLVFLCRLFHWRRWNLNTSRLKLNVTCPTGSTCFWLTPESYTYSHLTLERHFLEGRGELLLWRLTSTELRWGTLLCLNQQKLPSFDFV